MPGDCSPQTLSIATRLPCGLKNLGRTCDSTQHSPGDTNGEGVSGINLRVPPASIVPPEAQAQDRGGASLFSSLLFGESFFPYVSECAVQAQGSGTPGSRLVSVTWARVHEA